MSIARDCVPALHNCGPARSEVFTTKPVGTRWHIPLARVLDRVVMPDAERPLLARWLERDASPQRAIALITALVPRLLTELGDGGGTAGAEFARDEEHALALLGRLRETLALRGALPPVVGYVSHAANTGTSRPDAELWPPCGRAVSPTLAASVALLAFAHYAPPLVLWRRTPTLRWIRSGNHLLVREAGARLLATGRRDG